MNDGETRIYRARESWSEQPGTIHSIRRNASKTVPTKLPAVFVLDTNDKALTTPIADRFNRPLKVCGHVRASVRIQHRSGH